VTLSLRSELGIMLESFLTPALHEQGFQGSRGAYVARLRDLSWLVEVQLSKYPSPTELQFTMNCGVYVPEVFLVYFDQQEPKPVATEHCCLHTRVGLLQPESRDRWWELTAGEASDDTKSRLGDDVLDAVADFGLPFLQRFPSLLDVAKFLAHPRKGSDKFVLPRSEAVSSAFAAIIYTALGNTTESRTLMSNAARVATGSPVQEVIEAVGRRLDQRRGSRSTTDPSESPSA
jgi:hypothetical protein